MKTLRPTLERRKQLAGILEHSEIALHGSQLELIALYQLAGLSCSICGREPEALQEVTAEFASIEWCRQIAERLEAAGWISANGEQATANLELLCPECASRQQVGS